MDFEPLDEELEEFLRPIVEEAADTGWASDVDFTSAEYRELKRLDMFESAREYYDGTASVQPSPRHVLRLAQLSGSVVMTTLLLPCRAISGRKSAQARRA